MYCYIIYILYTFANNIVDHKDWYIDNDFKLKNKT